MFPQLGATAETLSKASTLVFRIGTDAHLYDDPDDVSISPLLDSRFDSDIIDALKRLLALTAQGFDASNFFPQVVKNVASHSLQVKKLVYLYLLHYAEKRPNEALLSINCFQKDLGDPNPLVRAWALRAMAGIRLHVISPLVLVAVGKCARDPSVYVRKCAANALPKLHDLRQEEHASAIEEIVGILLNDHSPGVVGAAAAAFASVCPTRQGLVKESIMFSLHCAGSFHSEKDSSDANFSLGGQTGDIDGTYYSELSNMVSMCYVERPDEYLSRSSYTNRDFFELNGAQFTSGKSNDDVKILLRCTSPLLWSNNSAVVLAAAGVHWIMAAIEDVKRIVKPLLFIMRSSNASKYVVLCNIQVFAKAMPSLFAPYYEDFFICTSDAYEIKALKLEILSSIATDSSFSFIFKEFQDYIRSPDRRFAAAAVAAIGLCAQRLPKMANTCMEGLLALIRQDFLTNDFESVDGEAGVLVHGIMSIKSIIKEEPTSHEKVIIQLVRSLDSIKVPAARAMIIWIVGEYGTLGEIIPRMLTTVLKYLALCFASEALETKLQIINTTVKVLLSAKGEDVWTLKRIVSYVLELALCDLNYDVRDRARLAENLLSWNLGSRGLEEEADCLPQHKDLPRLLAEHIFQGQTKPLSLEPINYRVYLPGSLSQIVLHAAPGYEPLPKPCTLPCDDFGQFSNAALREGGSNNDSYATDNSDTLSGSLDEESASDYGSRHSAADSSGTGGSDETSSASDADNKVDPLIQISDSVDACENQNVISQTDSADLGDLMSKKTLESWLDEQPGISDLSLSEQSQLRRSSARISIGNIVSRVKPKMHTLVDPTNGDGLKVVYSFSSETSTVSPLLICVELFFENCSTQSISEVTLVDEEPNKASVSADLALDTTESFITKNDVPTLVPMEEITSLEPGKTCKRILQVHFHHHLLPLKLTLYSSGKRIPVKLWPDIGYFVKPFPMDIEFFTDTESHLPGMFEYNRRCIFTDHIGELTKDKGDSLIIKDKFLIICESLALKMLSNANLFLISVDMPVAAVLDDATGMRLRFSSEILSNSIPCLITITLEGKCSEPLNLSIKVNCEETVFGLNLLNRVANFLADPSVSHL
ncbi:Adaptin_N domain-containing protein [Cephalotus follicularis]|uniref:AP-3 complex subunit beta n=1 Tax=Cephalotus follicularis TaxID=3775 RepID=A0A1Q3DD72_CEPFO|nr:Adaptin_N domain-containing protein [Cephalotus follicularis]